jgi:hypothetical protein
MPITLAARKNAKDPAAGKRQGSDEGGEVAYAAGVLAALDEDDEEDGAGFDEVDEDEDESLDESEELELDAALPAFAGVLLPDEELRLSLR